jgi:hypothetical protein
LHAIVYCLSSYVRGAIDDAALESRLEVCTRGLPLSSRLLTSELKTTVPFFPIAMASSLLEFA